jgi:hypothetical protein
VEGFTIGPARTRVGFAGEEGYADTMVSIKTGLVGNW